MKIITLDGIPTTGKTVLGNVIHDWLCLENTGFDVTYFNDTIRPKYGLDILSIKKDPENRDKITLDSANEFLSGFIDQVTAIEKAEGKNYLFMMDRLHYSFMDSLGATSKDFRQFEEKIKGMCFYICLNFENPTPERVYSRIKQSLILRSEHPFTSRHFSRLVGTQTSEEARQELIWKHYGPKIETYNKSFEDTILGKKKIWIDEIILKEDYVNLLTPELKTDILGFIRK